MQTITEIRDPHGGRNYIRQGDTVKATPPSKTRGFLATFRQAVLDDTGTITAVEVYGGPSGKVPSIRTFRPECIRRVAQTRNGERLERAR